MLNNREYYVLLIDYYGCLLTNHQNDILSDYFNDDLSMNEIANNENISKSAVQDLIKRSLSQLQDYEKKLGLIEKDKKLDILISDMSNENNALLDKYVKKIKKLK